MSSKSFLIPLAGAAWLAAAALASAAVNLTHVTYTAMEVAGGFRTVTQVAVDTAGNVYIVDAYNGQVWKETPANGTYTQTSITTAATEPAGVTVDSHGNLYISDEGTNRIFKETPAGNGYTESTLTGMTFSQAYTLTVDAAGNLYVIDVVANTVLKETVSGNTYSQSVLASGLNYAQQVAVDTAGNVYIADTNNNRVLEETLVGGSYTQSTIGTGLSGPSGIVVGANGVVYIADSYNGRTLTETPDGSSYDQAVFHGTPASVEPEALALSSNGNFYYVDAYTSVYLSVPNQLAEASPVNFGSVTLAGTPADQTVTFTFDVGGTLASTPYFVSTQGDAQLDFVASTTQPSGACITGHTYAAGDTCTVSVSFAPTHPGWRYGAASLFGPSGNSIGVAYLQGSGTSPQVSFSPGTFYTTAVATVRASGLVVDSAKNVLYEDVSAGSYIASYATPNVSSSLTGTQILSSGNFEGLGLDGAGNLFVVGGFNTGTDVTEQMLTPSAPVGIARYSTVGTTFTGFPAPEGALVDGSGNVLISDYASSTAFIETFTHGGYDQTPVGTGLTNAFVEAVDGNGAFYLLDTGNSRIVMETPSAGTYTQSTVMTGLTTLQAGVAVDGLGNVYIPNGTTVLKETPANGSYTASSLLLNNGAFPPKVNGPLVVDGSGNLLLFQDNSSSNSDLVSELDVGDAPTLSFQTTAVGVPSSDSPQKLSIVNNGNSTLTFSAPPTSASAVITAGFTLGTNTTCPLVPGSTASLTLAPGASCDLYISFVPTTGGNIQGTLTVTDNTLNVAGTQQIIHLNGIATGSGGTTPPPASPTATLTPASGAYGSTPVGSTSTAQMFTLTNTSSVALSITGVTLTGTNATDFAIASNGCDALLPAGATCVVAVTYTPSAAASASATLSVADNATNSPQTASLSGTGASNDFTVTATPATQSVAAGASANYTVNVASSTGDFSGAVTLSATGLPAGATVSFSPASLTPGSAGATSTLTIQTTALTAATAMPGSAVPTAPILTSASSAAAIPAPGSPGPGWPPGAPVSAVMCFAPFLTRRRLSARTHCLLLLAIITASLYGCGGGFAEPEGQTTTQPKVYTVTITGTSGTLQHSTTVKLTVQ